MKVGIIGHGFVGQAVSRFYKTSLIYDKYKPSISLAGVVREAGAIFVCVPTNGTKRGYDYRPLTEVLLKLTLNKYRFPVLIKSTVQPGMTDAFQKKYSKLQIFFNPEFLDQASAVEDFARPHNPPCQILGLPQNKPASVCQKWSKELFAGFDVPLVVTSALTAETFKLATNAYYATRVVFANQIYDFCKAVGADYELMASLWQQIPRLGTHGYQVFHQGGRGAGGYCLPKDLHALLVSASNQKVKLSVLSRVEKENVKLLANSGKWIKSQKTIWK